MENAIEINDLKKYYGDFPALKGLSFRVEKGSIHGFVGPNGAGKTTTIKILMGLLKPDEGKAEIFGVDVSKCESRVNVGYMPEFVGFQTVLTPLEVLELHGRLAGIKGSELKGEYERVLKLVGLWDRRNDKIKTFSKGMKQWLGLASALIGDPDLLILDEPTVGLDPGSLIEFRSILKDIGGDGKTIFISSHILSEIQQICTHVTFINKGVVISSGKLGDVLKSAYGVKGVVLELKVVTDKIVNALKSLNGVSDVRFDGKTLIVEYSGDEDLREDIFRCIVREGGIILGMRLEESSLEDAYLRLVGVEK